MDETVRELERRLLQAKNRAGISPYVVVRSESAGAHAGYLEYHEDRRVDLFESRRLWQWFGAQTLSEVAVDGVDSAKCKFGRPVRIKILDAIEIIDASDVARESINKAPIWRA